MLPSINILEDLNCNRNFDITASNSGIIIIYQLIGQTEKFKAKVKLMQRIKLRSDKPG